MDEFAFDLDKALDELEENEDKEQQCGGHGLNGSDDVDGNAGMSLTAQPACTMSLDCTDSSCDNHNNLNGVGQSAHNMDTDHTLEDRLGQNTHLCDSAAKLDTSESEFAPARALDVTDSYHFCQELTNVQNGLDGSHSFVVTPSDMSSEVKSFEPGAMKAWSRDKRAHPANGDSDSFSFETSVADHKESHPSEGLPDEETQLDPNGSHDKSSVDATLTDNAGTESVQHSTSKQQAPTLLQSDGTPEMLHSDACYPVDQSADGQSSQMATSRVQSDECCTEVEESCGTDSGSHGTAVVNASTGNRPQFVSLHGQDKTLASSQVQPLKAGTEKVDSSLSNECLSTAFDGAPSEGEHGRTILASSSVGDSSVSSEKDTSEVPVIAQLRDSCVTASEGKTSAACLDVKTDDVTPNGTTAKVVGFGDVSDIDLSNDELEQYLSTVGGPDNCTEYDSKPVFMEEVCVSQGSTNYGNGMPSSVGAGEGEDATGEQEVPVSDERRGSGGSVEKFLAPVVMSPGITTPIEDPGYSKVPGYVPELSVTVEENAEDLDASHAQLNKVHQSVSEELPANSKSEEDKTSSSVSSPPKDLASQSDSSHQSISRTSKCSAEMGGARPKEPQNSSGRISRPSSLLGLSTPDLPSLAPAQMSNTAGRLKLSGAEKMTAVPQVSLQFSDAIVRDSGIVADSAEIDSGTSSPKDEQLNARSMHDLINTQLVAQSSLPLTKKELNLQIKQKLDGCSEPVEDHPSGNIISKVHDGMASVQPVTEQAKLMDTGFEAMDYSITAAQPVTEHHTSASINHLAASTGASVTMQKTSPKQKRPSSLNIVSRSEKQFNTGLTPVEGSVSDSTDMVDARTMPQKSGATDDLTQKETSQGQKTSSETAAGSLTETTTANEPVVPSPPTSANINLAITQLGKVAPVWVPDAEAPSCMQCEAKFTFTKRRHHCRACGKIFCNSCCNLRSKLAYMDNKEARVCSKCYQDLIRAQVYERRHQQGQSPNPNNPSEYCSTVPPLQQAAGALNAPPPTVMVPSGVLRKDGNQRRVEGPKQVMFSDGIRPGGDLTELDGISDQRPPIQRQSRKVYHVDKASDKDASPHHRTRNDQSKPVCLIPEHGLPPVLLSTGVKGDFSIEENPDPEKILPKIRSTEDPEPVVFAINKNLFVLVKIVTLDCCVNRVCWCFSTKGMGTVGQDDIVIVLECLPDEKTIPRDIFCHMGTVYEEANKGNTVSHLGHTIFAQEFLDSRDHSGFLYINASYQCLQKLILPQPPFIFGILLQRWETPWAKVFPIRLMLRLGAEYRYYPCPLISVRFRKPVYGEIGHTIMNLLADFRNYQYMLPQVPGVTIHMGDKETFINFPRNRYNNVMKVLTNSNDHVMALAANFSLKADSHLVCLQNEDGRYLTQAINIQNKPRKVTGASFVVFNGAFKQAGGIRAKSSIVEDGLMVQITAKMMADLKEAMKSMTDYVIECGGLNSLEPEETITMKWVEDDNYVNIGIKSPIDEMPMDGIESIRIHTSTDFAGGKYMIRWTECFFIQTPTDGNSRDDPVDLSRLAESLAHAICVALAPHLDKLKSEHLSKIGLRATIDPDKTCYEVGSNGTRLPDEYMDVLDSALIPVIHNAATHNQDGPVVLELIFHIIE